MIEPFLFTIPISPCLLYVFFFVFFLERQNKMSLLYIWIIGKVHDSQLSWSKCLSHHLEKIKSVHVLRHLKKKKFSKH